MRRYQGPDAEGQHAFDAVVVGRGVVEDAAQELLVLGLVAVVGRQRRVRRERLGRRVRRSGTRHRPIMAIHPAAAAGSSTKSNFSVWKDPACSLPSGAVPAGMRREVGDQRLRTPNTASESR